MQYSRRGKLELATLNEETPGPISVILILVNSLAGVVNIEKPSL